MVQFIATTATRMASILYAQAIAVKIKTICGTRLKYSCNQSFEMAFEPQNSLAAGHNHKFSNNNFALNGKLLWLDWSEMKWKDAGSQCFSTNWRIIFTYYIFCDVLFVCAKVHPNCWLYGGKIYISTNNLHRFAMDVSACWSDFIASK